MATDTDIHHRFVSLAPDGADATKFRPSDHNASHKGNGLGVYNVMDNGVMGGGADDTTAMKAAVAAFATGDVDVLVPQGEFLIGETLDIPFIQSRRFRGAGKGATIITQTTDDIPIVRAEFENSHSIAIEDLSLNFATLQDPTNLDAYCLQLTAPGGIGTANGYYHWGIRRLGLGFGAIGVGLKGSGLPIWGSTLESLHFSGISLTAIDMGTAGVGKPNVLFRDIKIINTGLGIDTTSYAVKLSGVEALFEGLDIEGWYGAHIYVDGGAPVTIRGLHIEQAVLDYAFPKVIYIANGPAIFDGGKITGDLTSAVTVATLFSAESDNTTIDIRGIVSDWGIVGSGKVASLSGVAGSRIRTWGCDWNESANVLEYLPSSYGVGLYARAEVDGLPPIVDAYPTPAATYRGRRFRILGGAGVADEVKQVDKNAADAYVLVTK